MDDGVGRKQTFFIVANGYINTLYEIFFIFFLLFYFSLLVLVCLLAVDGVQ